MSQSVRGWLPSCNRRRRAASADCRSAAPAIRRSAASAISAEVRLPPCLQKCGFRHLLTAEVRLPPTQHESQHMQCPACAWTWTWAFRKRGFCRLQKCGFRHLQKCGFCHPQKCGFHQLSTCAVLLAPGPGHGHLGSAASADCRSAASAMCHACE
jgi:hypothetical protein